MENKLKSTMKTSKDPLGEKVSVEKAKKRINKRKERQKKYVFLDLETGGLNDSKIGKKFGRDYYPILQIALIVTDKNYKEIAKPLNLIIKQTEKDLEKVSDWSREQFKDTLMKECLQSEISLDQAEEKIIDFLKGNNINEKEAYLAGNSIRLDRDFITSQMPNLNDFLHYRMLDLTSLRLFMSDIYGQENIKIKKAGTHDALTDIRESIAEAKYYKNFTKKPKISRKNKP